jgi:hypothetical protein
MDRRAVEVERTTAGLDDARAKLAQWSPPDRAGNGRRVTGTTAVFMINSYSVRQICLREADNLVVQPFITALLSPIDVVQSGDARDPPFGGSRDAAKRDEEERRLNGRAAGLDHLPRGASEIRRELRCPLQYDHNHCLCTRRRANSLWGQNSAGYPEICATFQRDHLQRHF